MESYDIVVIGGGPSGAVFARFIDKKYKVLLLEKRDHSDQTNKHIKCCGGLLNEKAQAVLASLDYNIPTSILTDPQVFNVKVIDNDNKISKDYYKGYVNLDREKFDDYMLSKSNSNVVVVKNAIYHKFKKEKDDSYSVNYRVNGKLSIVSCKILVGADGANSQVAREIDPNNDNKYIAIQKKYISNRSVSCHYAIFDKEINDYYSWAIPKDNCILLGSILNKNNDPRIKFDILEKKFNEKVGILGECIGEEGCFIKRPDLNNIYPGGKNIPLIGEAAGFISPSSSEGISFAIKSGFMLAESLNKYGLKKGLKKYYKKCKSIIFSLKIKYFKAKLMYSPFIRGIIIKSGIFSNKKI